ncbi:MAG: phage terminase large subunit [Pseudomonadota bacterium]|nr:phage terminase large subunit [Pseudomonadota bacterium]
MLVPNGEIIYLGTPQTEMSLYNYLPERGYDIKVWPARYPNTKQLKQYRGRIADRIVNILKLNPKLAGTSTEPTRFSDIDLREREASYGRAGFSLQFMLDTTLSDQDRYPLKLGDMVVTDLDKEVGPVKIVYAGDKAHEIQGLEAFGFPGDRWHSPMWISTDDQGMTSYQGKVMFIDPSGRGKDETGYAVVFQLNGMMFLMDAGGFIDGYSPATLESLAEKAKEFQVNSVVVEDNFGDGMYKELFKPVLSRIYKVSIDDEFLQGRRSKGQKEVRIIETLEPVIANHRMVVNRKLVEKDLTNYNKHPGETWAKYSLFYQLTRISKDKGSLLHDDRLDALSGAVAYWAEDMSRDTLKAEKEHYDNLLEEELKEHLKYALGYEGTTGGFGETLGFIELSEQE